jgi:hypothetical protein
MRKNPVISNLLFGFTALSASSASMAQSINYQVLNSVSAVPTMGEWGLILLSAIILGGAFFMFRNAKRGAGKLLSVIAGLLAVGLMSANHDIISKAWANGSIAVSFNQGSTVVDLTNGAGTYAVTNPGPNSVRITGFNDGDDSCTAIVTGTGLGQPIHLAALDNKTLFDAGPGIGIGQPMHLAAVGNGGVPGQWQICPHGVQDCPSTPTPGCIIGSDVPASATCYVTLICMPISG